jgi:peptide chain release factor 1
METTKGKGKGGQRKNKVETAVRVTHIPTGISVFIDGRNQNQNKKKALAILEKRVQEFFDEERAALKKQHRDKKIHERDIIRTYNYSRDSVKDHRTKKTASIKNIMEKGRLDLLREQE